MDELVDQGGALAEGESSKLTDSEILHPSLNERFATLLAKYRDSLVKAPMVVRSYFLRMCSLLCSSLQNPLHPV